MADKFFPLKSGIAFGIDAQGRPVNPSPEFVRQWDSLWKRVGEYTAKTNIELDVSATAAQATADLAVAAAAAAQTTANTANATANALKLPTYVTLNASTDLTNERVLTQGANIVITDGGAGNSVTVALAANITGTATDMTIQPLAPGAAVNGGTMAIKGQNATGTNKNGGAIVNQAGDGTGTGVGGQCSFYSGGGRTGGAVNFIGGAGTVTGGAVNLAAGDGGTTGGNVNIAPGIGGTNPGSLLLNSASGSATGIQITDDNAGNTLIGMNGATPVAQSTGWGAPTGTATKTTFDTSTVTLPQLAERVKALIDFALLRGDIGA